MQRARPRVLFWVCVAALAMISAGASRAQAKQSKGKAAQQSSSQQLPPMKPAPPKIEIDSNPQLFSTMCALWAAGYESEASTAGLPPAWASAADKMSKMQGPATDALREYYKQHEHNDRAATLARFVSFAMVVGPPPDFQYTLRHDDLPPDTLNIEDFNDVMVKFYKEARLDSLWSQMKPDYEPAIELLQGQLTQIVLKTTGFLREILRSDSPRVFSVYVEPMVGRSMNFRTYSDHYVVVLNGGDNVPLDQVRHAFLHFILDPLPLRYQAQIAPTRPLFNIAVRAPRFPQEYKRDFTGFYTECLIKAAELELDHMTASQRAKAIDDAEADGFVLVRPLIAQLDKFQQTEPAMTIYFPEMAKAIDVPAEARRLQTVQFAPADAAAPLDSAAAEEAEKLQMLQQGERLMALQDGVGAQAIFEKVVARWPATPRAVYGLAISAAMQGHGERARDFFLSLTQPSSGDATGLQNGVIGPVSDPVILAWSHVYLGRLNDLQKDRDRAVTEYKAALAVPGAPESARNAAQLGVEKAYEAPGRRGDQPAMP